MNQRDVRDGLQTAARYLGHPATAIGSLLATFVLYLALAKVSPGAGSLSSTITMLVAFLSLAMVASPPPEKITMQRQIEVFSSRVAGGLLAYFAVGAILLWILNLTLAGETPLTPLAEGFFRTIGWPFQSLVHVSCSSGLPSPPGACEGFT